MDRFLIRHRLEEVDNALKCIDCGKDYQELDAETKKAKDGQSVCPVLTDEDEKGQVLRIG